MTRLRVLASRLVAILTGRRRDADLTDEIQAHLDLLIDEHARRGLPAAAARAAARREFGGVEQIKERYRDQRGLPFVETWLQDMRYAFRTREVVHRLDRELPVPAPRTMDDIVADSTASRRFQMVIVLSFAAAALLLACLGTYGVMTYAVQQRTHEIGIRLALGARRARILRTVLVDAGRLVAYGLIAGIPAAVAVGFAMRALLFGVAAHDGITLAGVCFVLTATAMFAALFPAWRASRIDPMVALRHE